MEEKDDASAKSKTDMFPSRKVTTQNRDRHEEWVYPLMALPHRHPPLAFPIQKSNPHNAGCSFTIANVF